MTQIFVNPFEVFDDLWISEAFAETKNLFDSANIKFPLSNVLIEKKSGDMVIQLALAGYSLEDLDLTTEDNQICIEGKAQKLDTDEFSIYLQEIKRGQFKQKIPVSSKFDLSKIEPKFVNGILSLRIPIAEDRKPKKILIK